MNTSITISYDKGVEIINSLRQQVNRIREWKLSQSNRIFHRNPSTRDSEKRQRIVKTDLSLIAYLEPLVDRPRLIVAAEQGIKIASQQSAPLQTVLEDLGKFLRYHTDLMHKIHFLNGVDYRRAWEQQAKSAYQRKDWVQLNRVTQNLTEIKKFADQYQHEDDVMYFVGGFRRSQPQVTSASNDYMDLKSIRKTLESLATVLKQ